MSGETSAVVRGLIHGAVQLRYTERGMPAARFTVLQTPREYDRTRRRWHDAEPVPVICTVAGPLARHVAECLADTVHVIATGHLTIRHNRLHLDSAQVGVDLTHHIAYIDDTLPAVLAGQAPAVPSNNPSSPPPTDFRTQPTTRTTKAPRSWQAPHYAQPPHRSLPHPPATNAPRSTTTATPPSAPNTRPSQRLTPEGVHP